MRVVRLIVPALALFLAACGSTTSQKSIDAAGAAPTLSALLDKATQDESATGPDAIKLRADLGLPPPPTT